MTGHVDEADRLAGREHGVGEAEVDGQPPPLLLLEPVRVGAGEGQHERGLAVVDVPGGRHHPHGRAAGQGGQRLVERGVVAGIDGAQVEVGAALPARGPRSGGSAARSAAVRSPSSAIPNDGMTVPGREPAPGSDSTAWRALRAPRAPAEGRDDRTGPSLEDVRRGDRPSARTGRSCRRRGAGRPSSTSCSAPRTSAARPQGPGQRMGRARGDQVGPAGDDAGLGTAEQLVAAEGHQRGAGGQRLAGRGLALQPRRWAVGQPRARRVEQAGADVGDHGHRGVERRHLRHGRSLDEALDPVVGRVDLQDEGHVGAGAGEGGLVVGAAGPVGGADVDEAGARLLHHLRHPEAAADLHALAPADHHLPAPGQGGEDEQHRRRRCCSRRSPARRRTAGPRAGRSGPGGSPADRWPGPARGWSPAPAAGRPAGRARGWCGAGRPSR